MTFPLTGRALLAIFVYAFVAGVGAALGVFVLRLLLAAIG